MRTKSKRNSGYAVSVIVPIFNEITRLSQCVDSLLMQTCQNIEIILVDDGSIDGSSQLISEIEGMHENVKSLFLNHGGSMRARLCGVDVASSKWIGFADADDTLEEDMYESLLSCACKNDADIILCGYKQFYPNGKILTYKSSDTEIFLSRNAAIKRLVSGDHIEMWSPCNKLFKNELFSKSLIADLSKVTIGHYEDLLMNYHLLKDAVHIISVPQCPYHYRVRYDSTSYTDSIEDCYMDELTVREMILEDTDQQLWPTAKYSFLQRCTRIYSELRSIYKQDHVYCQRVLDLILKHR